MSPPDPREIFVVGGSSDDIIYIASEELSGGVMDFKFTTPGGEEVEGTIEYDYGSWLVTLPKAPDSKVSWKHPSQEESETREDR